MKFPIDFASRLVPFKKVDGIEMSSYKLRKTHIEILGLIHFLRMANGGRVSNEKYFQSSIGSKESSSRTFPHKGLHNTV